MISLRCQRRLSKRLGVAVGYEYEQVFSNDPFETYRVNTVHGSLAVDF